VIDEEERGKADKVIKDPQWYAVQGRLFFLFTKRKNNKIIFTTMLSKEIMMAKKYASEVPKYFGT